MSDVAAQAGNPKAGNLKDDVSDRLNRGAAKFSQSVDGASGELKDEVRKLKEDMASIQETLSKLASNAGTEAYRTAHSIGSTVASQVSDMANSAAAGAQQQAKTMAGELESVARSNPLGTIGGTLVIGILIGMMSRGRG